MSVTAKTRTEAKRASNGKPAKTSKRRRDLDASPDSGIDRVKRRQQGHRPGHIRDLFPDGRTSVLLWSLPDQCLREDTLRVIESLDRLGQSKKSNLRRLAGHLESWLSDIGSREATCDLAFECLAWSHALPALARELDAAPWWQLLERIIGVVRDAAGISLDEQPLVHQLLTGELPLTLAFLLPEIDACRELAAPACHALSRGPSQLLDGDGIPRGRYVPLLRPLLACWTRAGMIGRELRVECFGDGANNQLQWLVQQAVRLTRHDGTAVFSRGPASPWEKDFVEAALALFGDEEDAELVRLALTGRRLEKRHQSNQKTPLPGTHSEWAEIGVLRSDWSRAANVLAVTYHDRQIETELSCPKQIVWSGVWNPEVVINQTVVNPTGNWEEVCWYSDADVDYLELEIPLADNWKIQRQMLLGRTDRFFFVADAVLGDQAARIDYSATLPLATGIQFRGAAETREGYLEGPGRLATIMPLALPEWRVDRRADTLQMSDSGVQLHQICFGRALYAPLFLDLDRVRAKKPATWRRLTVAEKLEIQPADVAVGYRVQAGSSQWVIYRSLGPKANRTVLGHNLSTEFYIGRFLKNGETEELLEIL